MKKKVSLIWDMVNLNCTENYKDKIKHASIKARQF